MQQMIKSSLAQFTVRLPAAGSYRLILYTKDLTKPPPRGGDSVFSGVGEYEIVCRSPQEVAAPFPPCAHTSWGAGDSAELYALSPVRTEAVVRTVDGVVELRVGMGGEDLRFTAKLKVGHF